MATASGFNINGQKIDILAISAKNSEKLGGQTSSYYATTASVATKQDKLTSSQLSAISSVSGHINDAVKHITSAERANWNGKQAALSTAQLSAISSVSGHINNSNIHVTSTDKSNWNAKATSTDISNAINALDVSDTAVANQFVTKVSETDGKISVSRAQPTIANVSGLQTALNDKLDVTGTAAKANWAANADTVDNYHVSQLVTNDFFYNWKADETETFSGIAKKAASDSAGNVITTTYATKNEVAGKVDKETGKGLSTNDYTTTEKNKLAGIAAGAEVNQHAFSNVVVGSTTIAADSKTDTLTFVAGTNITLTPDATNDKITISAKDTTYDIASMRAAGLLSVDDKTKLDNIEEEAQKNVKSDWAVTASDDDAYIKNKPIIPVVYNGRLTINRNNSQVAIFNANQSTDVTANISVPMAMSELQNDANYTTDDDVDGAIREHNENYTSHLDIRNDITGKEDKTNKVTAWSSTTSDTKYPSEKLVKTALDSKVDKVTGKGLSTNDYTTTEKNKLTSIAASAEVNQNAFSNITVGSTTIAADSKTDTLTMVAGTNVTLTPDATNDKITISAKDTTYGVATTAANGLMSKDDKAKLNGIAAGAEVNVQSDWSVTDSASDAFIKNKPSIPTSPSDIGAAAASHTHDDRYYTESEINTKLSGKQNTLTTQTAYSAKGTATKVPQITTNDLGQVIKIEEVTITQPTVNNGTLTIQKNGTSVGTFGANQSTNTAINITVPTKTSELSNDSNFAVQNGTYTATSGMKVYSAVSANNANNLGGKAASVYLTAHQSLAGYVPTARKVNGKALNADVTIGISDISNLSTYTGYANDWNSNKSNYVQFSVPNDSVAWDGSNASSNSVAWNGAKADNASIAWNGGNASSYSVAWCAGNASSYSVAWGGGNASIYSVAWNGAKADNGSIAYRGSGYNESIEFGEDAIAKDKAVAFGKKSMSEGNSLAFGPWYSKTDDWYFVSESNAHRGSVAMFGGTANEGSIAIKGNAIADSGSFVFGMGSNAQDNSVIFGGGETESNIAWNHSFALGFYNVANNYSYALGNHLSVNTDDSYKFAIGKYNVDGNYAFIVGNGTDDSNRSNALTVDWEGNVSAANFYGTFNGTATNATKLNNQAASYYAATTGSYTASNGMKVYSAVSANNANNLGGKAASTYLTAHQSLTAYAKTTGTYTASSGMKVYSAVNAANLTTVSSISWSTGNKAIATGGTTVTTFKVPAGRTIDVTLSFMGNSSAAGSVPVTCDLTTATSTLQQAQQVYSGPGTGWHGYSYRASYKNTGPAAVTANLRVTGHSSIGTTSARWINFAARGILI